MNWNKIFNSTSFSLFMTLATIVTSVVLYQRIVEIEQNVNHRIESTIKDLMPKPPKLDTAKRIIAPKLDAIGDFYYFDGKVSGESQKFINVFEYSTTYPREIWEGYITKVVGYNKAKYYFWSTQKITGRSTVSGWVLPSSGQLEMDYHKDDKDKIYSQILFPIVALKKPTEIN